MALSCFELNADSFLNSLVILWFGIIYRLKHLSNYGLATGKYQCERAVFSFLLFWLDVKPFNGLLVSYLFRIPSWRQYLSSLFWGNLLLEIYNWKGLPFLGQSYLSNFVVPIYYSLYCFSPFYL